MPYTLFEEDAEPLDYNTGYIELHLQFRQLGHGKSTLNLAIKKIPEDIRNILLEMLETIENKEYIEFGKLLL
jgi:hypothetical protein